MRAILCDLLVYLSMAVIGIAGAPLILFAKKGNYKLIKFFCSTVFFILRHVARLKISFRGQIPTGETIICAKHQSFLDVLMLLYILPEPRFIMKKELLGAPVVGSYARSIGCIPIDRSQKGEALRSIVSNLKANKSGQTVIYPQGTRVLPGSKEPYKVGAGVIYKKIDTKFCLVGTNTGMFWGRRSFFRYPGTAVIEFLGEVSSDLSMVDFMAEIEDRIEKNSEMLMREALKKYKT